MLAPFTPWFALEPYDAHPLVNVPPRRADTSLLHGRHLAPLAKLMKHDDDDHEHENDSTDSDHSSRDLGITAVSGSLASRIAARRRRRHPGTTSSADSERHHREPSKHLYIGALIGAALAEA